MLFILLFIDVNNGWILLLYVIGSHDSILIIDVLGNVVVIGLGVLLGVELRLDVFVFDVLVVDGVLLFVVDGEDE